MRGFILPTLIDLTVKDTIAMMFDLNYEGWSFHDWIDYV